MNEHPVFYNTLSKQKEPFEPLHPGKAGLYVCGPTVYGYVHIGNWRAYVFADTLRRVLEHNGYEVREIMNITDVGHLTADDVAQGDSGEDKILKKALAENKTPESIASFYENYFYEGVKALNILSAHYYPRATAHIPQMISLIEALLERGHAYVANGAVFYDVTTFPDYGKLSGNTLEALEVGARLEPHPDKRHPWDFALWLPAPKEHLMQWPSPWGHGYPGWHIECSAMSQEYLGDTLDIHTGGEDNIFPHHEAEIAQSEGATGKTFSHFFLHARHMMVNGEKMAKSKGNFFTLEDIYEKGYDAMDLRMVYLGSHYRSQMNFTDTSLNQARKNKEKLFGIYSRLLSQTSESARPVANKDLAAFLGAMNDDLNTPLALAKALELASEYNRALDAQEDMNATEALQNFQIIFEIFGLRFSQATTSVPEEVQSLAVLRQEARAQKDFAKADEYRVQIEALGYMVKDTDSGFEITPLKS